MSRRNPAQEALEHFGRESGFEKKSGTWYRQGDEVIASLDLQKSQYGPQHYLNLGFWLRELGDEKFPKQETAHISIRLETLVPRERDRVARLLDLEHALPDGQRVGELVALLRDRILPVIERGRSISGLRSMVEDGTLAAAAVRGPAQQALTRGS